MVWEAHVEHKACGTAVRQAAWRVAQAPTAAELLHNFGDTYQTQSLQHSSGAASGMAGDGVKHSLQLICCMHYQPTRGR
jgi:predicted Rdx family selenoprotein